MHREEAYIKSKGKGCFRIDRSGKKIIYNGVLCRQGSYPYNVINPEYYEGYTDWKVEENKDE